MTDAERSSMTVPDAVDAGDLVLLILGAPAIHEGLDGRCNGITRLEKLAFLLERETDFAEAAAVPTDDAGFRAYHYGPYSQKIYDAVGMLSSIGLVVDRRVHVGVEPDAEEEMASLEWTDLGAS